MTLDHAVALSLLENLPRINLTERLKNDPELIGPARLRCSSMPVSCASGPSEGNSGRRVERRRIFLPALATLTDLPPVLWYQGQLSVAEPPAVAIVGSRAASAVAIETASRLAADVAAAGITVVSGLARGVDSAAHRARTSHRSHHRRAGIRSRPCVSRRAHRAGAGNRAEPDWS